MDVPSSAEPQKPSRSFFSELPGLLLAALLVAVLIKTFIVQPFYIPSGSMIPTLEVNDRVMVLKLSYQWSDPARGDIVVFENPYAPEADESIPEAMVRSVLEALGIRTSTYDDLIKRVVATGGEEIVITGNQIYVDGVRLEEPFLAPGVQMSDVGPLVVPEDHVFVMGDNRNSSSDSRVFGPVPESEIIGRAVLRIWPLDRISGL